MKTLFRDMWSKAARSDGTGGSGHERNRRGNLDRDETFGGGAAALKAASSRTFSESGFTSETDLNELAGTNPHFALPENLHFKIMTRVRSSEKSSFEPASPGLLPKFAWAVCICVLMVTAAGLVRFSSRDRGASQGLPSLSAPIETANRAAWQFTAATPLQEEMRSMHSDFRAAAEHLLASMP